MTTAPELILHIGHFKTGTTALQVFCASNAAQLARQGLRYASTHLRHAKHSPLAFALLQEAGATALMHGYDQPTPAAQMWAALFDEVRDNGRTTLISTEEFARLAMYPAAVDALRGIVATAPDIRFRVIAYLRPPQSHLRSWYNQLVKMGMLVGNFDTAVCAQMEAIHWDYALALKPWIDIFGEDRIILRQFDDQLRDGDAMFEDFLESLGFHLPMMARPPERDPNPRLDDRALGLRRALSRAKVRPQVLQQVMIRAAASLDAETQIAPGVEPHDFAGIRDTTRAAIHALCALPHAALDPQVLLDDLPVPMTPEAREMSELVALLAGELANLRATQRQTFVRLEALEKRFDAQPGRPSDPPAGGPAERPGAPPPKPADGAK